MDEEIEIDLLEPPMTADDGTVITPLPDGSVEVDLEGRGQVERPVALDEDNLAEGMDDNALAKIGQRICELVELDERARAPWLERLEDGLAAVALTGEGKPPAMATGSRVVHPLIAEAAVQFQARALEEIFPSSGPVKTRVLGQSNRKLIERADRVERHMNWQMTDEDSEFFWDVDQMLLVLPLAGSDFKKTYWDTSEGMLVGRRVDAKDVIVPYKARSLAKARRITHRFWLDRIAMAEQQEEGFYLPVDRLRLQRPHTVEEQSIADASDAADASFDPDEDGKYEVLECSTYWSLEGEEGGRPMPYLISVERESQKVLSIRRYWTTRNGQTRRRCAFTHYKFLPGLGFYGYGYLHVIGGLQEAATSTLRSFMDAASFANWRGGFKTKEARVQGQSLELRYGVWQDVDLTAEELAKGFYTPDFREPSPAMVAVLERLERMGQRFAATTEASVPENNSNTPVGTTIARLEEAGKVRSGIHKRLHIAAQHEFRLRAELNWQHLDRSGMEFVSGISNIVITPEDYDPATIDVSPVSDPNIISTPQRIALAQAQLELARSDPAHLDIVEAERRYLKALRVQDIDDLIIDQSKIPSRDPVSEGAVAMTGGAIRVYPEQNHAAHIQVHMALLAQIKGSPAERMAGPILMAHVNAHMAAQYRMEMSRRLGIPIPDPAMVGDEDDGSEAIPPQVQEAIGMAAAEMIAQSGVQEGQAQPDPEAMLKMAQAKKTEAEVEEIKARTAKTRVDLLGGEETVDKHALMSEVQRMVQEAIKPLGQQLLDARAELEDALKARDEEAERARIEAAAEGKVREAEGKVKETEGRTEAEMVRASMQAQIDDLERTVARLEKELEKSLEPDDEDEPEKAEKPEPQPIVVNVGPINVDAKGGAKSMTLRRGPDGKVAGIEVSDKQDQNESTDD